MQKTFFEIMKQHQGEYMGSLLSGILESMATMGRPDADDVDGMRSTEQGHDRQGPDKAVKDNDNRFPPEWRLSKLGSRPARTGLTGVAPSRP